jgi:hypothetical protein
MVMIVVVIVIAGTLGSLTDWLFMGLLFHDAYNRYPEVWWPRGGNNRSQIIWSAVLGYAMTAAVVGLCVLAGVHTIGRGLLVAVLAWIGPAIVIVINGLFVKFDPKITLAHCLGYLARMVLAGVAAGVALSLS